MQFDNPRRLTITLSFPAPGNTDLNEIAVHALKDLVATAKTPQDLHDKVVLPGTPFETRVQVVHEFLKADDAGNLKPESD